MRFEFQLRENLPPPEEWLAKYRATEARMRDAAFEDLNERVEIYDELSSIHLGYSLLGGTELQQHYMATKLLAGIDPNDYELVHYVGVLKTITNPECACLWLAAPKESCLFLIACRILES
jgi:hypothetical protein